MIEDIRAMAVFAQVARHGSFTRAAAELGLSPSVVSYHVSQLEKRLGVALIYRSTRRLSLTHEGELLQQHAMDMVKAVQEGLARIHPDDGRLSGKLRLSLSTALQQSPLLGGIAEFANLHPAIRMQLEFSDDCRDLYADAIDLAFRAGQLEDSSLKARPLGAIKRKLVCSPGYFRQQPEPEEPESLQRWRWIKLRMLPASRMLSKGQVRREVAFHTYMEVNSVEAMSYLSILGMGLATPPSAMVDEALKDGRLTEVLPDWQVAPIPLYAVWPGNTALNHLVRRLLDFLEQQRNW